MRFRIREQFWSLGDNFTIQDADGNSAFFVDGKAFSWGNKLAFLDVNGNELVCHEDGRRG